MGLTKINHIGEFCRYVQLRHNAKTWDRLLKYNKLLEFSRVLLGFYFLKPLSRPHTSLAQKLVNFWAKFMSLLRWGYILGLRTFLALCYFHSNFLAFP